MTDKNCTEKYLDQKQLVEVNQYENRVTRKYIAKYGLQNVRGGDLTYNGKYIRRFNLYHRDSDWESFTTVILLMILFGIFYILYAL